MENKWNRIKLKDAIQFNPRETIKKGNIAKKVAMEKLEPFNRKISGYEEVAFTSGTKFRNGDTLLARITPCLENGKTAQVDILDKDEIGFGSTEYIVLREKLGITDNDFIYYLAISPEFRNIAIKSMNGSSGRQRVQKDILENSEIYLPDLKEQKAIAKILSDLDEKIEINNKINENLEKIAQAIFKQWFVDFEFPNENGEPYKSIGGEMIESELGEIPKSWKVGCIGDYVKVKSGFAFKSAWWEKRGIPVIKIKDINNNTIDFNDISFVSEEKVEVAKEFIVNSGDLLIAMTGATIGKFAIVPPYDTKVLVNQRVGKFFLGDKPVKKLGFIYSLLCQENIISQIISRGDGSAQPNISPSNIESIKIVLPNEEILLKYNSIVSSLFENIIKNIEQSNKIKKLRDTLLSKLMSGEIRVSLD